MTNKAEAQYRKLVADLKVVEERKGGSEVYLTDEGVDRENVTEGLEVTEESSDFWHHMYVAAGMAAGARAEELGFDINAELGYTVY